MQSPYRRRSRRFNGFTVPLDKAGTGHAVINVDRAVALTIWPLLPNWLKA